MEPMNTQSQEALRLFIAIDLPPAVRSVLHDAQSRLRGQRVAVRWVNPDGAHLTLKFLGAVEPSRVDDLKDRMQAIAARHNPFALRTGELGVFPDLRRPRVVWLAVNGDRSALQRLRDDVEATIAPLGFPTEDRPFSPHLTLGRTHKDVTPSQRAEVGRAVAQTTAPDCVSFNVNEIVLMRSELAPPGARYTPLMQARLAHGS